MNKERFIDHVERVIHGRRSVRHYLDRTIPEEALKKLVAAGIAAPSGSNWQNQRFLIINDKSEILRIGKARFVWPYKGANYSKVKATNPGGIIGGSGGLIIVFSDSLNNDRRGNGEYYIWENLEIQNCAAAIENILLLATAMQIGTCWVSASDAMNYTRMFSGQPWRALFSNYQIPLHYKLQGIIMLGYPKSIDEGGFPKGEKMHGATIWQSTNRRAVEEYLIVKRPPSDGTEIKLHIIDQACVRILSKIIQLSKKIANWCDLSIHQIEFGKYFKL